MSCYEPLNYRIWNDSWLSITWGYVRQSLLKTQTFWKLVTGKNSTWATGIWPSMAIVCFVATSFLGWKFRSRIHYNLLSTDRNHRSEKNNEERYDKPFLLRPKHCVCSFQVSTKCIHTFHACMHIAHFHHEQHTLTKLLLWFNYRLLFMWLDDVKCIQQTWNFSYNWAADHSSLSHRVCVRDAQESEKYIAHIVYAVLAHCS